MLVSLPCLLQDGVTLLDHKGQSSPVADRAAATCPEGGCNCSLHCLLSRAAWLLPSAGGWLQSLLISSCLSSGSLPAEGRVLAIIFLITLGLSSYLLFQGSKFFLPLPSFCEFFFKVSSSSHYPPEQLVYEVRLCIFLWVPLSKKTTFVYCHGISHLSPPFQPIIWFKYTVLRLRIDSLLCVRTPFYPRSL